MAQQDQGIFGQGFLDLLKQYQQDPERFKREHPEAYGGDAGGVQQPGAADPNLATPQAPAPAPAPHVPGQIPSYQDLFSDPGSSYTPPGGPAAPPSPISPYYDPTQPQEQASNDQYDVGMPTTEHTSAPSGDQSWLGNLFGGGGGSGGLLGKDKDWGSMLMALGGGIASGSGQGWGAGLGAGFTRAAAVNQSEKARAAANALSHEQMTNAYKIAQMRADASNSITQYGTPLNGIGKDGTQYVGALQKGGGVKWYGPNGREAPPGQDIAYAPGVNWQNFDEYRQPFDKAGHPVGPPIKRELAQAAQDKAAGTKQGDALAMYRSMNSKLPGLQAVVTKLDKLAETATYTTAGQWRDTAQSELGLPPRQKAVDRTEYIATVSNQILPLLRDTFGAQFTEREGETLRATMGDPNLSPQQKQAALKSFIEQKVRDVNALAAQTGQPPASGSAIGDQPKPAGGDPLGMR